MSSNYNSHNHGADEKRRHECYTAEAKVYFSVIYDVKTKVKFQVLDKDGTYQILGDKFPAISKDISAEGMRIVCKKELKKGDLLHLEIYLPNQRDPLVMEGEVRWSQKLPDMDHFDAGIKLSKINGKVVSSSVYHDGVNQIVWSTVLESVFGDFKKIAQKKYAI